MSTPTIPTPYERVQKALSEDGMYDRYDAIPQWTKDWIDVQLIALGERSKTQLHLDVMMLVALVEGMVAGEDWMRTQNRLGHHLAHMGRRLPREFF